MIYYHGTPVTGLKCLEAAKPALFDKPARVYLTTLYPMALLYGIKNYEYTYGYTREKQIYFSEYFPNALETLYRGKAASVYICLPEAAEPGRIPNEYVSEQSVEILEEIRIPDVCEALLEQERLGNLIIQRYEQLPHQELAWIRKVEKEGIIKSDLLHKPGPMADYYRIHYPDSWEDAIKEQALL